MKRTKLTIKDYVNLTLSFYVMEEIAKAVEIKRG